jgi:HSP20 family molecular chaperone IbpA
MVFSNIFEDPFFRSFFFESSKETKPPSEIKAVYVQEVIDVEGKNYGLAQEQLIGWKITYALAGFKKENVKVWSRKKELWVEGGNTDNELLKNKRALHIDESKFRCNFSQKFIVSDKLDLTKMTVTFEDGLLQIFIPTKAEVDTDKILHFGN